MVVAVTLDIPGGSEEHYQRTMERAFPAGTHPEGWLVHIAGPTESGWRVLNVAASQDQFETFARELLVPSAGLVRDGGLPQLTRFPVQRLIWNRAGSTGPGRRITHAEAPLGQPDRVSGSHRNELPRAVNASSTSGSLRMNSSSH